MQRASCSIVIFSKKLGLQPLALTKSWHRFSKVVWRIRGSSCSGERTSTVEFKEDIYEE